MIEVFSAHIDKVNDFESGLLLSKLLFSLQPFILIEVKYSNFIDSLNKGLLLFYESR